MAAMRVSILMLFFIGGVAVSCSTLRTDKALDPYVDRFVHDMGFNKSVMKGHVITFETVVSPDEGYNILGQCNYLTGKVTVDPKFFFGTFTPERRKTGLVYHELGHCVCLLDHDDKMLEDDCPASLMHSYLPDNRCMQRHWKKYVADLYDKCGD